MKSSLIAVATLACALALTGCQTQSSSNATVAPGAVSSGCCEGTRFGSEGCCKAAACEEASRAAASKKTD